MKAVVFHEFGGPEVLRYEDVPDPVPGEGEVVVEVRAVSVNRTLDLIVRSGRYAHKPPLPHVLGADPSGVVVAVGPGVTTRKVGDRVFCHARARHPAGSGPVMLGVHVWGGYAELVRTDAVSTTIVPEGIEFSAATTAARHAPLAFAQMRDRGRVGPGDWVLVMGASGGLGSACVQVARRLGGRVIAAAGSDERVEAAMGYGAEAGVNYRKADLAQEVRRITGGKGVAVVAENIGDPELFPKALESLALGGRLVTAGGHGGGVVPLDVRRLYLNQITIVGDPTDSPAHVEEALRAVAEGAYKVAIDRILPLSAAAEAHRAEEGRGIIGKVILDPTLH